MTDTFNETIHKDVNKQNGLAAKNGTSNQCENCGKLNIINRCGGCENVYYCNKQCQSLHWNKHKKQCKWKTSKNVEMTRKTIKKKAVSIKIKNIYIPRPGGDLDDEDDHECEYQDDVDTPAWHRHFEADELLDRYEPIRELGRGNYAVVYQGKFLKNRSKLESVKEIVIKKMRGIFHTENDANKILTELRILYALRNHRYIMKLYDIIPPKEPKKFDEISMVLELVGANLSKLLRTNQFFTALHVQYILYQILLGVQDMHSVNVAHQDLKPSNIYIKEDCSVKIGGFKKAYIFDESDNELMLIKKKREDEELLAQKRKNEVQKRNESNLDQKSKKKKRKMLFLKKKRKKKKKIKRAVCRHVVTRWYGSPEDILSEHKASTLPASDMYGIGAIFAELLQMQRENRPDPTKRGPIFPGDSCFPLSIKDQMDYASRVDQMQVIFDVIGSPDESEIAKITDEKARKYLRNLPQRKRKNLKRMFPGADKHALDLLPRMLKFDVDKRITIKEALEHKYFEAVKDMKLEEDIKKTKDDITCGYNVIQIGQKELRSLILQEVLKFNKYEEGRFITSGAMINYKLDIVLNGYIDIYIQPFLGENVIIPMPLIEICYRFLTY